MLKILLKVVPHSRKLREQKKWPSGTPESFLNGKSDRRELPKAS
jgi:hypothetical protein